jgi:general secretion pathway protein N
MRRRWYVIAAIAAFVISLVVLAPAATLYSWFKPKQTPAAAEFLGLQGSVSEGRMAGLSINGHPALNDLHWTLKPLRLLLAQAAFQVQAGGDAALDGQVALTPWGGVNLDNLRTGMGVKGLLTIVGQPYLPVDGQTSLDLKGLRLRGHQLKSAEGEIRIHSLAWTLAKDPLILGDFNAHVSTDGGNVLVKIEPVSGDLEMNGDAKLTVADQSYEAHLQLRAKAGANPMLNNLLSSIGQPDPQGWYHLRQHGKLQ